MQYTVEDGYKTWVIEDLEDNYVVQFPMMGIKPENIDVEFTDNSLHVTYGVDEEKNIGKLIKIPFTVDPTKVKVSLSLGVLTVEITKPKLDTINFTGFIFYTPSINKTW